MGVCVCTVNACGLCSLWQSLPSSLSQWTLLGVSIGLAVSLPAPSRGDLSKVWSLTMPLGWTSFCSTICEQLGSGQLFLLSQSLNTAFPELKLFLMLWVNSLASQRQMLIETSRQTLHSAMKHDFSVIIDVGAVFLDKIA